MVTREWPPDPGTLETRSAFIANLLATQQWVRGETAPELAAAWGLTQKKIENIASEASRFLKILGERDAVMDVVRIHAVRWLEEAGPDRVAAAKLLVDTVGGFAQRHEVKLELGGKSDAEIFMLTLQEIKADPELRAQAIAFLTSDAETPILTEGRSE